MACPMAILPPLNLLNLLNPLNLGREAAYWPTYDII